MQLAPDDTVKRSFAAGHGGTVLKGAEVHEYRHSGPQVVFGRDGAGLDLERAHIIAADLLGGFPGRVAAERADEIDLELDACAVDEMCIRARSAAPSAGVPSVPRSGPTPHMKQTAVRSSISTGFPTISICLGVR